ncbi:MAG: hypothetical protein WAZ77_01985 [Candidatus Nitrosopolaris sp.]
MTLKLSVPYVKTKYATPIATSPAPITSDSLASYRGMVVAVIDPILAIVI